MHQQVQSVNRLLASLPAADFDLVRPHLTLARLEHEAVLHEAGEDITRVYFPHTGVVSLVVDLVSGETIETGMVGRDSLVGGSSALDGKVALNRAIVQIAGEASVLDLSHLRKVAEKSIAFRTTLIRHEQLILVQAQQSAACNVSHTLEARLARWLLRCRDLMASDSLELTQEFLGQMLGVRRTSVTLVASTLQQAGLIRYRRGHIHIEDVESLQEAACECYQTVKSHSDRLLNGPS
jgi:CRP-like cAMP-binding protein